MAGQIIIVSGTSGSGKSTTCQLFASRASEFWLLYGIDHFMSATFPKQFGHHGARSHEGIHAVPLDDEPDGPMRWHFGELGEKGFAVLHEWVAAASRQGCNIILDHLMMTDPPILQDCIWRLQGLPVLFVSLKPDYDVLMERVAQRRIGSRFSTSNYSEQQRQATQQRLARLRPWFYQALYANDCYDLEIDTVEHEPEAVCALIEQRLAAGPGTAFEQLRQRYPQALP